MPITAPVMNSLASESKIVALPPLSTPLPLPLTVSLAGVPSMPIPLPLPMPSNVCEPMDCNPTPNGSPAHLVKTAASSTEDIAMAENGSANLVCIISQHVLNFVVQYVWWFHTLYLQGVVSGNGNSTAMQVDSTDDNTNFQTASTNMVVETAQDSEVVDDNCSDALNQS